MREEGGGRREGHKKFTPFPRFCTWFVCRNVGEGVNSSWTISLRHVQAVKYVTVYNVCVVVVLQSARAPGAPPLKVR